MGRKRREKKARRKVAKVMGEFAAGKLKSSSGQPVTDHAQAVAIALSEGRRVSQGKKKRRKARQLALPS